MSFSGACAAHSSLPSPLPCQPAYGFLLSLSWVDFKCRESFVGKLAPGETLGQNTYDTHPWRVRDHATRRLIKEWVGPRQPEPPATPCSCRTS